MTDDRRMLVLRAVVEDYIRTREPVGSGAVTKHVPLKVSPATVRNDMAVLEEEGYLVQPHTSAGRVPTEKGYRLFVDRLVKIAPLSPAQQRGIETFFAQALKPGAASLEETLRQAAHLLAQITGQIAIVASPSIVTAVLRHVEIVQLAATVHLLVIISDTGRVEQRTIVSPLPPNQSDVSRLLQAINVTGVGQPITALPGRLREIGKAEDFAALRGFIEALVQAIGDIQGEERSDGLYMSGAAQLSRSGAEVGTLAPLLDALEEQVVLIRLMEALSAAAPDSGVGVAIGSETHTESLLNASVVTREYGSTAFVGSIGPTHMNYPVIIAAVRAVAEYLSSLVGGHERPD